MKDYFIGQGTGIIAEFDTLDEMLEYHSKMPPLDRHFCKLYDRTRMRLTDGYSVMSGNPIWREWD